MREDFDFDFSTSPQSNSFFLSSSSKLYNIHKLLEPSLQSITPIAHGHHRHPA